jgi:hypothetical protein
MTTVLYRGGLNMCCCSESESFDFCCFGTIRVLIQEVAGYLTIKIALNFTMFPLMHSSLLKNLLCCDTDCLGTWIQKSTKKVIVHYSHNYLILCLRQNCEIAPLYTLIVILVKVKDHNKAQMGIRVIAVLLF